MARSTSPNRGRVPTGLPFDATRAKVAAMAPNAQAPDSPTADEVTRLKAIAARHGLSEEGLVDLVADIRRHARNRRRRLSDGQIEALIGDLGARR